MEAVWQIVALGLLGAVLAALLKKHTPELALLLAVAVCGAAALAAVRGVREVWAFLEDLLAAVEMDDTGSTRIGKYVFNHAFLIPGVIAITLCVILGFIFGGIML